MKRDLDLGVLPLSALLSRTMAAHTRDAESGWDESTERPTLRTWANVLRPIGTAGIAQRDLPSAARLSKRAVRSGLLPATAGGWVDREGPGASSKLMLTPRGRTANAAWEDRVRSVEDAWRSRFGDQLLSDLRSSLESIVGRFDIELPHHPQSYAPVDSSIVGGFAVRWGRGYAAVKAGIPGRDFDLAAEQALAEEWEVESGGRLYVGSVRGRDWRPVQRREGDTVGGLSLSALLSQATVGITIDYEGSGGIALSIAADFLRFVDDEGFSVDEQSRKAFAGLERHDYASIDPEPKRNKPGTFRLTDKGKTVRDAYGPVNAAIEKRWKRRYGTDVVRSLRSSLQAIVS